MSIVGCRTLERPEIGEQPELLLLMLVCVSENRHWLLPTLLLQSEKEAELVDLSSSSSGGSGGGCCRCWNGTHRCVRTSFPFRLSPIYRERCFQARRLPFQSRPLLLHSLPIFSLIIYLVVLFALFLVSFLQSVDLALWVVQLSLFLCVSRCPAC